MHDSARTEYISRCRNGRKYTGECHFVYQNPLTDQNAVLSFFMESEKSRGEVPMSRKTQPCMAQSDQWKSYFDTAQKLTQPGNTTNMTLTLNTIMGKNVKDFWRYSGSLTTPPCSETVTWTIFKEEIDIFDYEFAGFRHDLFFESFRGPQPLFSRRVYRSFANENRSSIPDEQCCIDKSSSTSFMYTKPLFLFAIVSTLIQLPLRSIRFC